MYIIIKSSRIFSCLYFNKLKLLKKICVEERNLESCRKNLECQRVMEKFQDLKLAARWVALMNDVAKIKNHCKSLKTSNNATISFKLPCYSNLKS